jgi:NADH-quinone oxidoreductase subunit N
VPQVTQQLEAIGKSLTFVVPELILACAVLIILLAGLFRTRPFIILAMSIGFLATSTIFVLETDFTASVSVFYDILRVDGLGSYLKLIMAAAGILTLLISLKESTLHPSEYCALILAVVLGGNLLVMSHNFLMVFLSLEMISICSYVLAGFAFTKTSAEGSFKYFLFGSVASATMLYGFSILYGTTGSLNYSSTEFFDKLLNADASLTILASFMVLAGFLYKIASAPMHPWVPDVYEASPIPVIAFLSVAPKAAGFGILIKFVFAIYMHGLASYDWQTAVAVLAILTITIGNFSALRQTNPKRMMAYSSIAQSGFLLIGLASFAPQGIHSMLFYLTVYLIMNFVVFIYLQYFESRGVNTIAGYSGLGKDHMIPLLFLLIGMIALTGLPPTAGFTAKLLIFSSLWEAFSHSGSTVLLILLVFGIVNTVVSLFYYLRIPYFAYLKNREVPETQNIVGIENVLAAVLVVLVLLLFFTPNLLMGWINKINFVF